MNNEQREQKTLLIFRHGETDWNVERRLQGHTNIHLNENGRSQARRLREFFSQNPVDVFLTSDLSRAHETAKIAAGHSLDGLESTQNAAQTKAIEIIIEPRLRETHLGQAEGLTRPEIDAKLGSHVWEGWAAMGPAAQNARFPDGETKAEHLARLLEALETFLKSTSHTRIGVATHGGAMRRLFHHFRPDVTEPIMVGNCVVYEVTYDVNTARWDLDLTPRCR